MLDYLKDKKEVGFFQSIQALMQTCRWDPWPLSSSALLPPGLLLYPRPPGPGKGTEAEEHRGGSPGLPSCLYPCAKLFEAVLFSTEHKIPAVLTRIEGSFENLLWDI